MPSGQSNWVSYYCPPADNLHYPSSSSGALGRPWSRLLTEIFKSQLQGSYYIHLLAVFLAQCMLAISPKRHSSL